MHREFTRFKILTVIAALGVGAAASPGAALPATPEADAETAARAWLALVDTGDYAQSWDAAARTFRNSITRSQWVARAASARGPLGAVKSRELSSSRLLRSLPGAPDGEYVVIEFRTSYEHKAEATETVTPMRDPDGRWRVSGYYIR